MNETATPDRLRNHHWRCDRHTLTLSRQHYPETEKIAAAIRMNRPDNTCSARITMQTGFGNLNDLRSFPPPDHWQRNAIAQDWEPGKHCMELILSRTEIPTLDEAFKETADIVKELEQRFMTAGEHLNPLREFAETRQIPAEGETT